MLAGLQVGARLLRSQVAEALGPTATVGALSIGWSGVVLDDVRIRASVRSWPVDDELRAGRILVVPDLRGLLSADIRIARIRVDRGYLSAYRSRDGRLHVLPSLLEQPDRASKARPLPAVTVGEVALQDAEVELFDASVRRPAVRQRLERIALSLRDLRLPDLKGPSKLQIDGVHKGVRRDGTFSVAGDIEFASLDSTIRLRLRGVDVVSFQPYLIQAAETGVRRGTLDLDITATVRKRRLHAPGTLVLTDLELAGAAGAGTFAGLPQRALVGFMKDRNDRITVRFTLQGDLDDPGFSLNENFAARVASALGETLGVSVETVVRGVGNAAGEAAKGVGGIVKKIFGR
ncbi:MAG: DUF748 domain-containing protein [Burkholderiales bacterium]|nr:DUF748 domain-containing protein [Burkholderiales bacterium]